MTRDDMIRISRKWARGFLTGGVVVALIALGLIYPHIRPPAQVDEPPLLLGVPDDFQVKYAAVSAQYPEPFRSAAPGIEEQQNDTKNIRLYEACPQLWPGPQETGDCVSMGGSTAVYVRTWVAAKQNGRQGPKTQFFPPYHYGITRVQIGNGSIPCRSAGAYPSDFVRGFEQFGWIEYAEADAAGFRYSGRLADQWGCDGPPRKLIDIGKTRSGGDAYPIRSLDEWRDAICNGYPCTVAIPWKPGRTYRGADGRTCFSFDGRNLGGHQICSIGYDGSSGKPYWLLFNSHGANWPAGASHADGTPAGSVWVDEKWAGWIIQNGELWAISDVPGFQADELDLNVFNDLNLSMRAD